MVCESYATVALPWQHLEPAVVLVVEPGRVSAYDGDAFLDAASLIQFREASTDRVVEFLQPRGRAALPPVAGDVVETLAGLSCWHDMLPGL
jgi:predicted P-loop ATPase/GTPase